jgi:hypothetical protein
VRRKTSKQRLRRFVTATVGWCKANRHVPLPDQWRILCGKRRGHSQYSGVAGNRNCLQVVSARVVRGWRQWLTRRSQRARMPGLRFTALLHQYPLPRSVLRPLSPVVLQGVLV